MMWGYYKKMSCRGNWQLVIQDSGMHRCKRRTWGWLQGHGVASLGRGDECSGLMIDWGCGFGERDPRVVNECNESELRPSGPRRVVWLPIFCPHDIW